jgi:hypothetical protein
MHVDAYRLWQQWQQMHYPRRGLPADESARARLVALDGTAGTALDRYFGRGTRAKTLDGAVLATLGGCRLELDAGELSADACRYFGRLRQLIELVLADARPRESNQPDLAAELLTAKQSP